MNMIDKYIQLYALSDNPVAGGFSFRLSISWWQLILVLVVIYILYIMFKIRNKQ